MSNTVFKTVSPEVAYRRAGGRRRVNAMKQAETIRRQDSMIAFMMKDPFCSGSPFYGVKTRLAKRFGVSRQTIHRDLSAILMPWRPQSLVRIIDMKRIYLPWWQDVGSQDTWWTERWFGKWWESTVRRNQDRIIWKKIGRTKYQPG